MKNAMLLAAGLTALSACDGGLQNDPALSEYAGFVHPVFLAAMQECPKNAKGRPMTGEIDRGTAVVECKDTNGDGLIDVKRSQIKFRAQKVCFDQTGRTFEGPECEKL